MHNPESLLAEALKWLDESYDRFTFYVERDIVWTIQGKLVNMIKEAHHPYKVYNNYPILRGKRRSISTDLAIIGPDQKVLLAVEFKYEPSHERTDILGDNFPVVSWGQDGIGKDVRRVEEFVKKRRCKCAVSVFVDEGRWLRQREPHEGCKWIDWRSGAAILYTQFGSNAERQAK